LTNPDKHIQDLFSRRLSECEAPVSDHMWSAIENRLPAVSGGASFSSAGKSALLKWAGITAVSVGALATVVYLALSYTSSDPIDIKQEKVSAPTPDSFGEFPANESQESVNTASDTVATNYQKAVAPSLKSTKDILASSKKNIGEAAVLPDRDISLSSVRPAERTQNTQPSSVSNEIAGVHQGDGQENPAMTDAQSLRELSASFTPKIVDEDQLRWLFIPQADRASAYHWDFGDGTVSDELAGAHSFEEEGNYEVTLTVTDRKGNTISSSSELDVRRPGVFNPVNVFTPNGDLRNDFFDPLENAYNITRLDEIMIFDQRGNLVIRGSSPFTWDGRSDSGENCTEGVYRYVLNGTDTRGFPIKKTGMVQLFRD
jgi:hypothetical protein